MSLDRCGDHRLCESHSACCRVSTWTWAQQFAVFSHRRSHLERDYILQWPRGGKCVVAHVAYYANLQICCALWKSNLMDVLKSAHFCARLCHFVACLRVIPAISRPVHHFAVGPSPRQPNVYPLKCERRRESNSPPNWWAALTHAPSLWRVVLYKHHSSLRECPCTHPSGMKSGFLPTIIHYP